MTCVLDSVSDACVSWYSQTVTRYRIRSRSDTCRCPHYMVAFCHSRCCADSRTWRYFHEKNRDHCQSSRRSSFTPADETHTTRQSQNWTCGLSSQYFLGVSEAWRSEWNLWRDGESFDQSSIRDSKVFQDLVFKKWGQRTRERIWSGSIWLNMRTRIVVSWATCLDILNTSSLTLDVERRTSYRKTLQRTLFSVSVVPSCLVDDSLDWSSQLCSHSGGYDIT